MKRVSATEARKKWFKLIEQAGVPGSIINIQHRDLPDVILMSLNEFESWQETMEIMADPELMEAIAEAKNETEFVTLDELKKEWESNTSDK